MDYEFIRYEVKNGVAYCILHRPDKLNSFNATMSRELRLALEAAGGDSAVRAVVLTGAGRGFCAGQDLSDYAPKVPGQKPELPNLGDVIAECYNPLVKAIRFLEKPVIGAVNGIAAGAGANLAFLCDIVLAAKDASFVQSFAKVGLVPDTGGTFFVPRLMGLGRATALAMLAEKITSEQACAWGLVYKVFPNEELMTQATAMAEYLATQPTRGLWFIKQAFNASLSNSLEEQLLLEQKLQGLAGQSHDFVEGVAAFFERRQPHFRGV